MKFSGLLFLILLLLAPRISSQDSQTKLALKLIEKYNELNFLNGSVLVAENDKIILSKAYGFAEFDARQKMTDHSIFVLASISKSITSIGILKLVDQGKISLNDELVSFFPELPYKGVTIKHLLSNTSGIPEYRPLFAAKWDPSRIAVNDDVIEIMSEDKPPLQYEPGSQFRYSNTGFVFLASVIEKVSGKNYNDFLKDEIFLPAGMERTIIHKRENEYDIEDFAFPYIRVSVVNPVMIRPEEAQALSWMKYLDGVNGDVSTASTTHDLYKMDRALLQGKILSNKTLQEAFTPAVFNKDAAVKSEDGYGYGWFITRNNKGEKIVMHEGGMPGTSTCNYINIDDNRFIVVLSNTNYTRSLEIAEKIADIFEGIEVADPKPYIVNEIAKYIEEKGSEGLIHYARELHNSGNYEEAENDINMLGYNFLQQNDIDIAIEIFKFNTELYPDSWNAYDSLGEGYMNKGNKEMAIENYKRSVELNPDNTNGIQFLEKLTGSK
jgi:CubicO group peptidase (beta-lactamase class C family)